MVEPLQIEQARIDPDRDEQEAGGDVSEVARSLRRDLGGESAATSRRDLDVLTHHRDRVTPLLPLAVAEHRKHVVDERYECLDPPGAFLQCSGGLELASPPHDTSATERAISVAYAELGDSSIVCVPAPFQCVGRGDLP